MQNAEKKKPQETKPTKPRKPSNPRPKQHAAPAAEFQTCGICGDFKHPGQSCDGNDLYDS